MFFVKFVYVLPSIIRLMSISATIKVTDEEDVGDLVLIKFGTTDVSLRSPIYAAVCEGLILSEFLNC